MPANNIRDFGTLAHALVEMALREGQPCAAYIGRILTVEPSKHFALSPSGAARWIACPGSASMQARLPQEPEEGATIGNVTDEMAEQAQVCVDWVMAQRGEILLEQDVPIEHITGEPGATGRTDCAIIDGSTLTVADWKFGFSPVSAEKNTQLALYALGGIAALEVLEPFENFRFVIIQPQVSREPFVWECTRHQLENFATRAAAAAELTRVPEADLVAGAEQCKYCRAKPVCPAILAVPQTALAVEFADLTAEDKIKEAAATVAQSPHLARFYEIVPLIEQWIDAVNAAMHIAVTKGEQPDYKIVAGRKGARAWSSQEQAEALMKSMRLKHDEMYDYSIISPTKAEKVLAESPRRWEKLHALITQAEGKPTIAKATDKRPALTVQMEALTGAEDLV